MLTDTLIAIARAGLAAERAEREIRNRELVELFRKMLDVETTPAIAWKQENGVSLPVVSEKWKDDRARNLVAALVGNWEVERSPIT